MYCFVAMTMKRAAGEIALSPIEQELNLRETIKMPKVLNPDAQAAQSLSMERPV
jgi:hypothetical protein